jgi:hypothetical protein
LLDLGLSREYLEDEEGYGEIEQGRIEKFVVKDAQT